MNWLHTAATIVHVLFAIAIVGLVLLQRGRGADAGAGFGAGASGTVFGARGSASFLSRLTATFAALFFVTSLTLAYLGGCQSGPTSVIDRVTVPETPTAGAPVPENTAPSSSSVPSTAEAPAATPASPSK